MGEVRARHGCLGGRRLIPPAFTRGFVSPTWQYDPKSYAQYNKLTHVGFELWTVNNGTVSQLLVVTYVTTHIASPFAAPQFNL